MWYEIIPSFAIVAVALAVPPIAGIGINWLFLNGKTLPRRWLEHPEDFQGYLRDRRLTGSEYKPRGLEGLPVKE